MTLRGEVARVGGKRPRQPRGHVTHTYARASRTKTGGALWKPSQWAGPQCGGGAGRRKPESARGLAPAASPRGVGRMTLEAAQRRARCHLRRWGSWASLRSVVAYVARAERRVKGKSRRADEIRPVRRESSGLSPRTPTPQSPECFLESMWGVNPPSLRISLSAGPPASPPYQPGGLRPSVGSCSELGQMLGRTWRAWAFARSTEQVDSLSRMRGHHHATRTKGRTEARPDVSNNALVLGQTNLNFVGFANTTNN